MRDAAVRPMFRCIVPGGANGGSTAHHTQVSLFRTSQDGVFIFQAFVAMWAIPAVQMRSPGIKKEKPRRKNRFLAAGLWRRNILAQTGAKPSHDDFTAVFAMQTAIAGCIITFSSNYKSSNPACSLSSVRNLRERRKTITFLEGRMMASEVCGFLPFRGCLS